MAEQQKPFPYGSYLIAHCLVCAGRAALVCVTCRKAMCYDHTMEFGKHTCIHNRKEHDGLRKLSEGGMVIADEVTFLS